MNIPAIVADEHNEAFAAWYRFRERNIIAGTGNYLLHVDHHADIDCGGYDWDFTRRVETAEDARRLTDRALGIADFIVPAVYQGLFSTVHILKNLMPRKLIKKEKFVCLRSPQELITGDYVPLFLEEEKRGKDSGTVFYTQIYGGLCAENDLPEDGVVLDVDLDYFCWDDALASVPEPQIEITKAAYEDFWENKRHPLRLLPRRNVKAAERDGKYYLVYKKYQSPRKLDDEETIISRIDRLLEYLARARTAIRAVDVCRSSRSGYLPGSRAAFVEREFLARLGKILDLDFWQQGSTGGMNDEAFKI